MVREIGVVAASKIFEISAPPHSSYEDHPWAGANVEYHWYCFGTFCCIVLAIAARHRWPERYEKACVCVLTRVLFRIFTAKQSRTVLCRRDDSVNLTPLFFSRNDSKRRVYGILMPIFTWLQWKRDSLDGTTPNTRYSNTCTVSRILARITLATCRHIRIWSKKIYSKHLWSGIVCVFQATREFPSQHEADRAYWRAITNLKDESTSVTPKWKAYTRRRYMAWFPDITYSTRRREGLKVRQQKSESLTFRDA